jgi:hypothetical protein
MKQAPCTNDVIIQTVTDKFHCDPAHASRRFFQFLIFFCIKKQKNRWPAPIDKHSVLVSGYTGIMLDKVNGDKKT